MKRGDVKHGRVVASKSDTSKTFKSLSDDFISNAKIRGLSEWTIRTYQYQINYFTEFAGEDLLCKDINLELMEAYLCYLKEKKQITNPATLNSSIQNISPVIKYGLKKRYILNQFQMPYVKGQETFKDIYTEDERKTLLEAPSSKDFTNIRTHTIIWVLASTGIRARELRELKNSSVDLITRAITINQTKNKKPRRVPISISLYDVLSNYIEIRCGDSDDYLFPTVYNEIMAMTTLQDSVQKYCNQRGIRKTSLHLFRHTFITFMLLIKRCLH